MTPARAASRQNTARRYGTRDAAIEIAYETTSTTAKTTVVRASDAPSVHSGARRISAQVIDTRLDGDIQMEDNRDPLLITDNTVGGNIQIEDNAGGVEISGNTVDGNLECENNQPAPTGGNNTVRGDKEDQCSGL